MHEEWGEELILETYKLPWLIWIQLVVLFLLVLLLSYFGLVSIDAESSSSSAAMLSPAILSFCGEQEEVTRNCSEVGKGNQEAEGESSTGGARRRDGVAREEEGRTAATTMKNWRRLYHPCHYFEIAKHAFLQCLGLSNSTAAASARREQHPDSRTEPRRNEE